MALKNSCDNLAEFLNSYVTQAADRTFEKLRPGKLKHSNSQALYDQECRLLRSKAIKAEERASTKHDFQELFTK